MEWDIISVDIFGERSQPYNAGHLDGAMLDARMILEDTRVHHVDILRDGELFITASYNNGHIEFHAHAV